MSASLILICIAVYFGALLTIAWITGRKANAATYFIGNKASPWYAVAFGMLGDSLSGVTYISVPGDVTNSKFSYLQLVLGYFDKIDEAKTTTEATKEKCNSIEKKVQSCLQKTSILRYRAFENVGSDLSFSISMLDNNNDGFILTGIYGRNDSTTYAKPIEKGLSRYDLSEEEKEVLKKAIGKK